jgi:hypothetical protein
MNREKSRRGLRSRNTASWSRRRPLRAITSFPERKRPVLSDRIVLHLHEEARVSSTGRPTSKTQFVKISPDAETEPPRKRHSPDRHFPRKCSDYISVPVTARESEAVVTYRWQNSRAGSSPEKELLKRDNQVHSESVE